MPVFDNHQTLLGASGAAGGYTIDQSIRFNDDDSAYLTKTFASAGNRKTWTFSTWVKFANIKSDNVLFSSWISSGASAYELIYIDSAFKLRLEDQSSNRLITTQVFRDVGAWYHVVARVDTTDATSSNRYQLWINGERITSFSTETQPSLNFEGNINKGSQPHYLGRNGYSLAMIYSDLYQAETHFIDGTALDASSFGEANSDGVWVPIEYTGSYGTNGFYITGEDSADLGADYSGNSNDFTSSGLTSADQMLDTPTDNFCTLSPIDGHGSKLTLSDGNLRAVPSAAAYCNNHGTFYVGSGKWVYECKLTTVFGEAVGWSPLGEQISGSSHRGWFMFNDGRAYINTTNQGTLGTSLSSGDYRYIFYDADNQAMWFAHCDVSSGTPTTLVYENGATKSEIETGDTSNAVFTSISAVDLAPGIWMDTSGVMETNFGQSAFYTTSDLPTGFNTLSTANLPDPTIADPSAHMQTTLYTGNGTAIGSGGNAVSQIENSTFQPDFVWIKNRSAADNHMLYDAVRGATKDLHSNTTDAEATDTEGLSTFDADGFTVGSNVAVNTNTENYVAWQWKANGSGSSNTDGSITSTVSANTTSGFSIATYTGNATSSQTIGHGLGQTPSLVMFKELDSSNYSWQVYHVSLGYTQRLILDGTNAATAATNIFDAAPNSTVFTIGNSAGINTSSSSHVMYSFAEVEGFSKFGSYTGNGSTDGPFVYCGFRPAFLIIKCKDTPASDSGNWKMYDTARSLYNPTKLELFANSSSAEFTPGNQRQDFLSNGFKLRDATDGNESGKTYIFVAFAESPFKTATAR